MASLCPALGLLAQLSRLASGAQNGKAQMWSRHFMSRTPQQPVELWSGEEMCDTSPPLLPHSFPPTHSSVAMLTQSFPMIMGGALVSYNCVQYFFYVPDFLHRAFWSDQDVWIRSHGNNGDFLYTENICLKFLYLVSYTWIFFLNPLLYLLLMV